MPEAINYTNGLSNAWSNVATFIPKLVVFLIILAVGLIAALDQLHVATNVVSAVLYATPHRRSGSQCPLRQGPGPPGQGHPQQPLRRRRKSGRRRGRR